MRVPLLLSCLSPYPENPKPCTSPPGETLCDEKNPIILERMDFPDPVIKIAIEPKSKVCAAAVLLPVIGVSGFRALGFSSWSRACGLAPYVGLTLLSLLISLTHSNNSLSHSLLLFLTCFKQGDLEKMGMGLNKLAQEDPSFNYSRDEETGQTVIEGMGELHLEIIVDRLRREFKVGMDMLVWVACVYTDRAKGR